jgi:hypothetical protein
MYILFDISVLCFFALVLTVIAIARHVLTCRTSVHPQRAPESTVGNVRNQQILSERF